MLGAGESGVGTAMLCKANDLPVFVSDKGTIKPRFKEELDAFGISYEHGQHNHETILGSSLIVKSPGIPNHVPILKEAEEKGVSIISEIEFASYFTDAFLIGITGTNGKTTTTNLTYHLLKGGGLDVKMVGNVGTSFARQLSETDADYFVIEMSSFQLDYVDKLKFNIGVLLNITPDHLDRYNGLEGYAKAKFNITKNQTQNDLFVYNCDDPLVTQYYSSIVGQPKAIGFSQQKELEEGAFVSNNHIQVKLNAETTMVTMEDILLRGAHNRYNTMAALVSARALSIRKENIRESLGGYKNVEHRLEFVTRVRGVDYINDSKATNVNATWYALESMETQTVWILGGIDKGNDYSELYPLVKDKVRAIVCLGVNNEKIRDEFHGMVDLLVETQNMKDAVNQAYRIANKDETVLLAPACASFDLFEDYVDRGNQFKRAVMNL